MPSLAPLLNAENIAVVGASESSHVGRAVLQNLQQMGFQGRVYAVNPTYQQVLGLRCYPSLREIPGPVDTAVVLVAAHRVWSVLNDAAATGVKAMVIPSGGFADRGEEGRRLQGEMRQFALEHDMAICGPNCMGVISTGSGVASYIGTLTQKLPAGGVCAVAQSGSIIEALVNGVPDLGYRHVVSTGNEAVLTLTDYIEFFLHDPHTTVICCFVEGFQQAQRFLALAQQAVSLDKPLIVLKVGKSEKGRRMAMAHTGALAGTARVQEAVLRQRGVILVDDLDEMVNTARLVSAGLRPTGGGVAALTVSGGEAELIVDLADQLGVSFPEFSADTIGHLQALYPGLSPYSNPLDLWGKSSHPYSEVFPHCAEIIAADPGVNLLCAAVDIPAGQGEAERHFTSAMAQAVADAGRRHAKPVAFFSNISGALDFEVADLLRRLGVPCLQGTRNSLNALRHLAGFSAARSRPPAAPASAPVPIPNEVNSLLSEAQSLLTESQSKQVLTAFGIPTTREEIAHTPEEALAAAARIGYPVALKVLSVDLPHKSDVGGIELNLTTPAALMRGYKQLVRRVAAHAPLAQIEGVLVSEMIQQAVETIVGIKVDPQFGPVVVFGMGGVFVEVLGEVTMRGVPLAPEVAEEMICQVRGSRLLQGVRGRPASDIPALVDLLVKVGEMGAALQDRINELDINPVMVRAAGQGAIAADALIVPGLRGVHRSVHSSGSN